jgi:hypothetical protein
LGKTTHSSLDRSDHRRSPRLYFHSAAPLAGCWSEYYPKCSPTLPGLRHRSPAASQAAISAESCGCTEPRGHSSMACTQGWGLGYQDVVRWARSSKDGHKATGVPFIWASDCSELWSWARTEVARRVARSLDACKLNIRKP